MKQHLLSKDSHGNVGIGRCRACPWLYLVLGVEEEVAVFEAEVE